MLYYKQMDAVDHEKVCEAIVYAKGKPKGFAKPDAKELAITLDGIEFKVVFKHAPKLSSIWKEYYLTKETEKFYDPEEALRNAKQNDLYFDDSSDMLVTIPLENSIPDSTPMLTPEQVEKRLRVFVTIANLCAKPDIAQKILEQMPKKKNKTLHKGRKQDIAYLNVVDQRGWTYQIVAKSESDTQLCIEMRSKVAVTIDLVYGPKDLQCNTEIFF